MAKVIHRAVWRLYQSDSAFVVVCVFSLLGLTISLAGAIK